MGVHNCTTAGVRLKNHNMTVARTLPSSQPLKKMEQHTYLCLHLESDLHEHLVQDLWGDP